MRRLFTDRPAAAAHDWHEATELFMLRCRSRNLTQHSLSWYQAILKGFRRFLDASGDPKPRETPALTSFDPLLLTRSDPGTAAGS